jgi:hypothetical protein
MRPLASLLAAVALLWVVPLPAAAQGEEAPASEEAAPEEAAPEAAPEEPVTEEPVPEVEEPPPAEPLDLSFDLPLFGHTTFSMTSTTTARFRGQNDNGNPYDDDFFSLQQRFDLVLQGDELRLEVRVDGWLPFAVSDATIFPYPTSPPVRRPAWFGAQNEGAIDSPYGTGSVCPPGSEAICYLGWDVRPERMVLRWEHESWSIEIGDAQLVFGRGIALSFRKVDLLAVDNALRGGHVRFDDGHFRFRLHAGIVNPQNQDPITLAVFQDPEDFVVGGGVGATFGPDDMINTGAHALRMWFQDEPGDFNFSSRTADVLGYFVEVPGLLDGQLALYAEANAMRRTWVPPGVGAVEGIENHSYGRAVYASAQLSLTELTLLIEWKDYRDFLVAPTSLEGRASRIYSAAPGIEFDGPQRLRAIGNQRGASIRMDYAFLPGPLSFSLNFASFGLAEETNVDPWDDILVTHGWATLSRRQEYDENPSWSLELTGGYRRESYLTARNRGLVSLGGGDVDREMIHGLLSAALGSGDHSLEISADHRYETQRTFSGGLSEYHIGGVSLTYTYGIQFVAALTMRWSNFVDPVARAQRYGISEEAAAMFPSLELQWNFDPGTFVRGMIGATPGGQICSGGVCRDVPPFEGGMLQFVGRL